jgi:hypothetical protein
LVGIDESQMLSESGIQLDCHELNLAIGNIVYGLLRRHQPIVGLYQGLR